MQILRTLAYVVIGFAAMALAVILVTAGGQPPASNPTVLFALLVLFAVPPIGAFWMMYVAIRFERNPLPFIFLAFLPFAFVWYYFERVRKGKPNRNSVPAIR